ncbi:addiction module component CHP02574 family protein [Dyadobacter sp. CY345]|uniref:addiction module component CHP02574 family protein n=1 Tax=Dyadobacter sp. CY345 TaxID=2909335 RepID=UPI001F215834|nr:addiction module component CHP02574 family protein [Dyadobacter sp. CY345]MCF2447569.1 addiction module component CHP02574 family protein [Dyadobacter sp. CY345]
MKLQVIQDSSGKNTGVFIPIDDWTLIKSVYPDIETLNQELPKWQKEIIDLRLDKIEKNPGSLKPIEDLFKELDKEI